MPSRYPPSQPDHPFPPYLEPLPSSRQPPSWGNLARPSHAGAYSFTPSVGYGQAHGLSWLTAHYVQPHATEFVFREASLSRRVKRFKVTDATSGNVLFVVKRVSWRWSTLLCNAEDVVLYRRFERGFVGAKGRRVRNAYGYSVAALRGHGYEVMRGGLLGACGGFDDESFPRFEAEGDLRGKNYVVREVTSGTVVAEVRKMKWKKGGEKDKICVRVAPGNNAAFLVFFVVGLDVQRKQNGSKP